MNRYRSGEQVGRGIYLNLASGEFFQIPAQGTVLPEGSDRGYVRIPAPLVLVMVPLMGLGYIIFLPMLGIAGLLAFATHRLARLVLPGGWEVGRLAVPSLVPGVSYLVRGRRGRRRRPSAVQKQPPEAKDEFMGELGEDLRERRDRGEK